MKELVNRLAKNIAIPEALLASKKELEALILSSNPTDEDLLKGWRGEILRKEIKNNFLKNIRTVNLSNFNSTSNYIVSHDLSLAVNAAIDLEKPLLIKGEPGTGKTMLADQVAKKLNLDLVQWHIKSTTKAQQGLYEYDAVSRLRDSQLGDSKVEDVSNYIKKGKLWQAFTSDRRVVLLIDEIDKADIEFPNDLLQELDKMEFLFMKREKQLRQKIDQ